MGAIAAQSSTEQSSTEEPRAAKRNGERPFPGRSGVAHRETGRGPHARPASAEILLDVGARTVRVPVPRELSMLGDAVRPRDNDIAELVRAAAECVLDFGVAKTTADDIAERAGCSRATLYRRFPGGTSAWISEVVAFELAEVVVDVLGAVAAAEDLPEAISAGVSGSVSAMRTRPVLARLLDHEREVLLPELLLERASPVFTAVGELVVPALAHLCSSEVARSIGEWGARLVMARVLQPDLPGGLPVEGPQFVEMLARTYLLPGLFANARGAETPRPPIPTEPTPQLELHP